MHKQIKQTLQKDVGEKGKTGLLEMSYIAQAAIAA